MVSGDNPDWEDPEVNLSGRRAYRIEETEPNPHVVYLSGRAFAELRNKLVCAGYSLSATPGTAIDMTGFTVELSPVPHTSDELIQYVPEDGTEGGVSWLVFWICIGVTMLMTTCGVLALAH